MKVKITRIDKDLPLPKYQTGGSVGCDLYARITTVVPPKTLVKIPTNIIVGTPKGYMFMITLRSSAPFKKGLIKANGVGIGDQDFCGPTDEYNLVVYNITDEETIVEKGERIGQGIFVPIEIAEWQEVDEIKKTDRGGFGSTGHK